MAMVNESQTKRINPESSGIVNSGSSRARKKRRDNCLAASHVPYVLLASSSRMKRVWGHSMVVELLNFSLKEILQKSSMDSSSAEELLSDGLLPVLPVLLGSSLRQVSLRSAEILGAAALWSYEMNVKVASDKEIVSAFVAMITRQDRDFSRVACDALMDLGTTSVGREKLRDSGAVEQLFFLFCQVSHFLCKGKIDVADQNHLLRSSGGSFNFEMEGIDFLVLVLDAITLLVFDENVNLLALVSKDLAIATLSFMQELWARIRGLNQKQLQTLDCNYKDKLSISFSGKRRSIANIIFRLAMEQASPDSLSSFVDTVKKGLFGDTYSCFEHFIQHHWECCPMLIRKTLKGECNNDISSLLLEATQEQNIHDILDQIVTRMVSCPPVSADNLNVLDFLREIQDSLGHPMVYGQDIRLVRSVIEEINGDFSNMILRTKEEHFFREFNHIIRAEMPKFVCLQDCKQAYKLGYTIAIRGMEFRLRKISEVADALAVIFGQASVGANLYLTPPNSQGLSAHYDDHCVLVCQLAGNKRWNVLPCAKLHPRLYEPLSAVHDAQDDVTNIEEILLTEGDILYIPRGFPHAAHTINGDCGNHYNQITDKSEHLPVCLCGSDTHPGRTVIKTNMGEQKYGFDSTTCKTKSSHQMCPEAMGLETSPSIADEPTRDDFSLHLTFGIEVEPPFEWEGIIHIALHCWEQHQKVEDIIRDYNSEKIFYLGVQMLHIAIRNLGDSSSLLRKACTVAAPFWNYDRRNRDWVVEFGLDADSDTVSPLYPEKDLSSEEVFSSLIGTVRRKCNFADAYTIVETNVSNLNCDSFQWMNWLQHLPSRNTSSSSQYGPNFFSEHLREMLQPDRVNVLDGERAFLQVQSRFSNEVNFDETCERFQFVLEKYRHARKQYINGMLALHSS